MLCLEKIKVFTSLLVTLVTIMILAVEAQDISDWRKQQDDINKQIKQLKNDILQVDKQKKNVAQEIAELERSLVKLSRS